MKRLAIISTHPIQYNAPWFRRLAAPDQLEVRVFFTWRADTEPLADRDFGRDIAWDVPLLDGYDYEVVAPDGPLPTKTFWNLNRDVAGPIRAWGADAVLVIGWNHRSHLSAMRYFHRRIPVYFRGDSTLLLERAGPRRYARRVLLKGIYSLVDIAFFVGANNYDYFRIHGLKDNQLCFAPHAVDNDHFARDHDSREAEAEVWRDSLGIPSDSVVFLFAGKFSPVKALDLLLASFQRLAPGRSQHLVLVGNGRLESMLRERARGTANVHFVPFQNQSRMPVVYRLGDVICLTSVGETWGLAVNEAMACSRTVIVSDTVGCARDLVPDATTGYVHDAMSVTSLAAVMASCRDRTALREQGKVCREFIGGWSADQLAANIREKVISTA